MLAILSHTPLLPPHPPSLTLLPPVLPLLPLDPERDLAEDDKPTGGYGGGRQQQSQILVNPFWALFLVDVAILLVPAIAGEGTVEVRASGCRVSLICYCGSVIK